MGRSALIVAEAAEERRAIALLLKPTELFENIRFCGSRTDVIFLLEHSRIDIIFCDVRPREKSIPDFTHALAEQALQHSIPLVFFSHLDPVELPLLGIIPMGSHCLSYESSPSIASALIRRLLKGERQAQRPMSGSGQEATFDTTVGTYNRFYFDAILDQEISRSKLTGRPFALLLIEPDSAQQEVDQKTFNVWNSLLPSVALTIKTQVRTSDLLCRLEKMRLALLLPETDTHNAEKVVARIRRKTEELTSESRVNLKFGLATPSLAHNFNRLGLLSQAEASL